MSNSRASVSFIDTVTLNQVQKEAVLYNKGPQLVFAGAGTGKTRVLTTKIAFLIKQSGVFPNHIFAATFTNKAAAEMRSRVEELTGIPCTSLWIGTFHSLCARILRREAHKIGYESTFTIYDEADQLSLIKKVMKELRIDERTMQPRLLRRMISKYKNACIPHSELDGAGKSFFEKEVINAYGQYQRELKQVMAMDFDDLLTNMVYLLRKHRDVLETYQNQFKYILVDEYQDTNLSQFYLVKLFAKEHQRIFVVGDDDQSIYSWRGAKIENILSFDREFPDTKVYKLEQNYRSSQTILDFANSIISSNKKRAEKKLWTSLKSSRDVVVNRYRDDRQEADTVAEKINELNSNGIELGDTAILFRTNAQSRIFEEILRKRNIQYVLVGGISFYERKEVKDCLAYLRLLVNPLDSISCERILNVPPRGIGAKTQEKLAKVAGSKGKSVFEIVVSKDFEVISGRARKGLEEISDVFLHLIQLKKNSAPPQEILSQMLTNTGYIELLENEDTEEARMRLENINELLNALTIWDEENPEKTLPEFLEEISLVSDIDRWKQGSNAVNLMTLHSAKGLEFKAVFLVGLEDGLIPSRQNFDDEFKLEEECRLFYVGTTRAQKIIECSYVDTRMRFGLYMPMTPSRFLVSVPPELYRFVDQSMLFAKPAKPVKTHLRKQRTKKRKNHEFSYQPFYDDFSQETVQYRMGQIVSHNKYGQGKILSISGFGADMRVTILFHDGSRKRMMAKFANLQAL